MNDVERKGVPVEEEPPCESPERCCICRERTRHWTKLPDRTLGAQVALCEGCAPYCNPDSIPGKRAWCERERILELRADREVEPTLVRVCRRVIATGIVQTLNSVGIALSNAAVFLHVYDRVGPAERGKLASLSPLAGLTLADRTLGAWNHDRTVIGKLSR